MKNLIYLLAFATVFFSACDVLDERVQPSGTVTTELRSEEDFSRIDVSHAFEVEIMRGTTPSVSVATHTNIHDLVEVNTFGNELEVRLRDGFRLRDGSVVKIIVVAPEITHIVGSGATEFEIIDPLVQDELDVDLSGASHLFGAIEVSNLNVETSGASEIDLSGTATDYRLRARGASDLEDFALTVENFDVDLSGGSKVDITVTGTLSIVASGASVINFMGDGQIVTQSVSGASEVNRR